MSFIEKIFGKNKRKSNMVQGDTDLHGEDQLSSNNDFHEELGHGDEFTDTCDNIVGNTVGFTEALSSTEETGKKPGLINRIFRSTKKSENEDLRDHPQKKSWFSLSKKKRAEIAINQEGQSTSDDLNYDNLELSWPDKSGDDQVLSTTDSPIDSVSEVASIEIDDSTVEAKSAAPSDAFVETEGAATSDAAVEAESVAQSEAAEQFSQTTPALTSEKNADNISYPKSVTQNTSSYQGDNNSVLSQRKDGTISSEKSITLDLSKQEESDDVTVSKPIKVMAGYQEDIRKKDLLTYILAKASESILVDIGYYNIIKSGKGYYWEIHEGGSGKGALSSILEKLDRNNVVHIESDGRVLRISKSNFGIKTLLLKEDDRPAISKGIAYRDKMKSLSSKGDGFVWFGAILMICSMAFYAGAVAVKYIGIDQHEKVEATRNVSGTPILQLEKLKEAMTIEGVYVETLSLDKGVFVIKTSVETKPNTDEVPAQDATQPAGQDTQTPQPENAAPESQAAQQPAQPANVAPK